ncbi:hypothetical protein ACFQH6_19505 [Halobacteriaceae archaeon GCM10025711]
MADGAKLIAEEIGRGIRLMFYLIVLSTIATALLDLAPINMWYVAIIPLAIVSLIVLVQIGSRVVFGKHLTLFKTNNRRTGLF